MARTPHEKPDEVAAAKPDEQPTPAVDEPVELEPADADPGPYMSQRTRVLTDGVTHRPVYVPDAEPGSPYYGLSLSRFRKVREREQIEANRAELKALVAELEAEAEAGDDQVG